jgi:electron transfer flavoprotein beta subunit
MKIVVLVKHVPEPTAIWRLAEDFVLDRASVEGRLSQLDEYACEQAVRLAEAGYPAEITYLTMGPAPAAETVRKALAMGGDQGVHVLDDALRGTDALATSLVLAKAIQRLGFDLVLCGMASTDAEMSVVPSMVAERLGVPQATNAAALSLNGGLLTVRRETEGATEEVEVPLPALVSVTDQSGEPRYPSFKGIIAARKRPLQTWSLADIGIDVADVGLGAAKAVMFDAHQMPPRSAGTIIADEGDAAARLTDFLVGAHLV